MNDELDNSDIRIPEDVDDVHEIAGAETEQEKNLAVAQARLIGDL